MTRRSSTYARSAKLFNMNVDLAKCRWKGELQLRKPVYLLPFTDNEICAFESFYVVGKYSFIDNICASHYTAHSTTSPPPPSHENFS